MICIIALIVFAFLGIFSVRYRKLFVKSLDCVFRRVTLRPCQSGLDQQLRTQVIGYVSKKHVGLARFVVKYFELISWTLLIIMLVSMFFTAQGIYYYVMYGNCNGLGSDEFCVFDKLNPTGASTCEDPSIISPEQDFTSPTIDDDPSIGPMDAKVVIIEFGCYDCLYTQKAYPVVKELLELYEGKILYVYRDFPLPSHNDSGMKPLASECADEQGKYWEFYHGLFTRETENSKEQMKMLASDLGLDREKFDSCMESEELLSEVMKDFEDGRSAGVYGTPTFFINEEVVVGPKPIRYFQNIIDRELK
jgi:hypothetical protein